MIQRGRATKTVFPVFELSLLQRLKIDRSICAIFKLAINSIYVSMRIPRHAAPVVVFPLPFGIDGGRFVVVKTNVFGIDGGRLVFVFFVFFFFVFCFLFFYISSM